MIQRRARFILSKMWLALPLGVAMYVARYFGWVSF